MKKFDTILWRVNGIFLLLGILIIILGFVYSMAPMLFTKKSTYNEPSGPVLIADSAQGNSDSLETFELRASSDGVPSEQIFTVSLTSQKKATARSRRSRISSYKKSGYYDYHKRNILFYNIETFESHWLFGDNSKFIIDHEHITSKKTETTPSVYLGSLYTTAEQKGDSDSLLTIWSTDNLGKELTPLIKHIDTVKEIRTKNKETIVIYYIKNGKYLLSLYSLDFKHIKTSELSLSGLNVSRKE